MRKGICMTAGAVMPSSHAHVVFPPQLSEVHQSHI